MSLRPLGHRILVKPDAVEPHMEDTPSGLIVVSGHSDVVANCHGSNIEVAHKEGDHVSVSGTVVELGPGGNQQRYRTRQRAIQDCLEVLETTSRMFGPLAALKVATENIAGLLGTSEPEREVHIGDRVAYPVEVGQRITEDGEEYLILNEDDVAVLVMEAEEAA